MQGREASPGGWQLRRLGVLVAVRGGGHSPYSFCKSQSCWKGPRSVDLGPTANLRFGSKPQTCGVGPRTWDRNKCGPLATAPSSPPESISPRTVHSAREHGFLRTHLLIAEADLVRLALLVLIVGVLPGAQHSSPTPASRERCAVALGVHLLYCFTAFALNKQRLNLNTRFTAVFTRVTQSIMIDSVPLFLQNLFSIIPLSPPMLLGCV